MRFPRSILPLCCAALAACSAARPPDLPVSTPTAFGLVSGTSPERVQAVALLLDDLAPRVPLVLPGCEARRVDVRLVSELANENWMGATFTVHTRRWMELPESETDQHLSATMAHELVHYLLGREWSTLPGIMEEGLCDNVAHLLVPESGPLERAKYAVMLGTVLKGSYRFTAPRVIGHGESAVFAPDSIAYVVGAPIERERIPSFEDALRYDSSDLEPIRTQELRGVLDALGYLMVSRIGACDLFTLCQRARIQRLEQVPPSWLLEAAGLDRADADGWLRAADSLFGEAEKRALLRYSGLQYLKSP